MDEAVTEPSPMAKAADEEGDGRRGAIVATMVMMTVIGPRDVIVPTTTAIARVVYAMTCQLPVG